MKIGENYIFINNYFFNRFTDQGRKILLLNVLSQPNQLHTYV